MLFKCLDFELKKKQRIFSKLKEQYNRELSQFKSSVSWLDYKVLLSKLTKSNKYKISNIKLIHSKKLRNLGVSPHPGIDADQVIFNFSNRVLTEEEKSILKFGLDFGLPGKKTAFVNHFLSYEKLANNVFQTHKQQGGTEQSFGEVASFIKTIANENFNQTRKCGLNPSAVDVKVLKNLSNDESIIVTKPDKGRGVVIMDKQDYLDKTEGILGDVTKFKELNDDWFKCILRLEDKLNRFLRSIKTKLTDEMYGWLYASGCNPGCLYGLPKIHKIGCPIRPILSAIGTFNYNLAKFFVPILTPITQNEFTIKNSSQFVSELLQTKFNKSVFMAIFDVQSLFTNIPLDETMHICVDLAYQENLIPNNLSNNEFKTLLELAVKKSVVISYNTL